MPKYKSNDIIRESFIEKLFTSVGKGLRSRTLKHIAKTDPEIAKSLKDLEVTEDMQRKPNASGGLAKMLGE